MSSYQKMTMRNMRKKKWNSRSRIAKTTPTRKIHILERKQLKMGLNAGMVSVSQNENL